MRLRPLTPACLFAVGAVALGACGGSDPSAQTRSSPVDAAAELEHIHGLGEDPGSGELFVATHYGLFRAPRDEARLQRAGESRQDTMGFSVVGEGRFIGSGHPDPAVGGPGNLGLIASEDQGRTWNSISLSGEADFHVLRSSGRQVYGVNGGVVMASADGGRTWATRTPPGDLFDLAIDPADPRHVVASTAQGIFTSRNAGAGWRPRAKDRAGLLAWPTGGDLTLVDEQGAVARSIDDGATFAATGGTLGSTPSAFGSARTGLLAALGDGTVMRSDDAGTTWRVRARP